MGLGTKIKNALHGDDRRKSADYEDGRLPGSFPSDTDPATTKAGKHTKDTTATGRTSVEGLNNTSTLRKSQHRAHQKSDSGVGFTGVDEPGLDSKGHQPVGFADNTEIEQPQPVKPASLGTPPKRDPYWGSINNRGTNNAANTNGAGVNGFEKDLPLRPGSQHGTRDVYAKDFVSNNNNNNGGYMNNGNAPSNLNNTERDPYWSTNGNGSGLDGNAYGVNGYDNANNTYGHDGMYNSPPGTAISNDSRYGTGVRNGKHNTHSLDNPHDVNGSGLHERGMNSGDRSIGLSSAGMLSPGAPAAAATDDTRIRDRDMGRDRSIGYDTAAGVGAGMTGIAASEAARRHHEADMRDAGYHSPTNNGNPTNTAGVGRMNGNSVSGSRAAYGASAGGNPQRTQQQHSQGPLNASSTWPQQQQQQQNSSMMHFGPGAHNPARVLHTCTSCGVDNDISQYFRPDVAYRLGQ